MNPGDTISRYRIIGPLGKGGMGVVYQAEDTRLNRPVALKFLPADSLTPQDRFRFLNEARAAAAARHPNICPIYDVEDVDGTVFIVMAYLEGETLHKRLRRGPFEIAEAVDIATQIAGGLECAHQLGIVHRDIKSANVIVGAGGHASILDFGLALVSGETRLTTDGQTVGTAFYMSPEQAQGHAVDRRTDLWSLGVVLFEMLTATLPFRRDNASAALHAILHDEIPDIAALRPGVPHEVIRVVRKALARNPGERYQTAAEMARDLKRIQSTSNASQADLVDTQAAPVVRARSRRMVLGGVAAAMILGIGMTGYIYRGHSSQRRCLRPRSRSRCCRSRLSDRRRMPARSQTDWSKCSRPRSPISSAFRERSARFRRRDQAPLDHHARGGAPHLRRRAGDHRERTTRGQRHSVHH